jgi:hypothetical protein
MGIKNWSGGVIRKTPVTPAGPYSDGAASGMWTLERVAYWRRQGLWPTAGNINPGQFVENIFASWLYTGTGATQTVTNNVDTSTNGGLVWIKSRSAALGHRFTDTARGVTKSLDSTSTAGEATEATGLTAFGTTGFTIGADLDYNTNAATYVSWTFRKKSKFFDIVTYTGTGANRTISHSLGSVPGCIIIKRTDATAAVWPVYHRSLANTEYMVLSNQQNVNTGATTFWNSTTATDTVFSLGTNAAVNASGGTYVAYIFAHNAGGFGTSGTDNVISCGTYLGSNHRSKQVVELGFEPQWVMVKNISTGTTNWVIVDNMRSMSDGERNRWLRASETSAESTSATDRIVAAPTGFFFDAPQADINASGDTFIYMAIRRGPMKTPTSGTSVFNTSLWVGNASTQNVTGVGFSSDVLIGTPRNFQYGFTFDRLRGCNKFFISTSTGAETATSAGQDLVAFLQDGFTLGTPFQTALNNSATDQVMWNFRRAPGFLDVVCYTGTGVSGLTLTHNLQAVPELMIVKNRSASANWGVYSQTTGNTNFQLLNLTNATAVNSAYWNNTSPTSTTFTVGSGTVINSTGDTFVAYLFASCPGVSKVGSYTGTGTTQQINCGFTSSARFVLIKRTDSTGDWYVWDSARGIVAGNDPYLLLNSTAAEVTSTDYIDSYSLGFEISSTAPAAINANGGTFIFLAIA